MEPIRVLALTGMLGSGYSEDSLRRALLRQPHVIGCDGGSSDLGPYYLGSGQSHASDDAVARDLGLALDAARAARIPLIIGSAGTAGGSPHVRRTVEILVNLCRSRMHRATIAIIDSEIEPAYLVAKEAAGELQPLFPGPEINEQAITSASRFVAMMGIEPFIRALKAGADIVVAGRSSDAAIFAAYPVMRGVDPGIAWHAGKILECGAAAVTHRTHPDCMVAELRSDAFQVEPPNPAMRCTPQSVAAHALYENADPFIMHEPGGVLDLTNSTYRAISDRAVEVRGSRWTTSPNYTVRIEGAALVGYRSMSVGAIHDPMVLRQLDGFLEGVDDSVATKARESLGLARSDYRLRFLRFGDVSSPAGVGITIDVVAADQLTASAVSSIAWHTALHHPVAGWSGLVSNIAFPFSPPSSDLGPVFEFSINHTLSLADPCEPFTMDMRVV